MNLFINNENLIIYNESNKYYHQDSNKFSQIFIILKIYKMERYYIRKKNIIDEYWILLNNQYYIENLIFFNNVQTSPNKNHETFQITKNYKK